MLDSVVGLDFQGGKAETPKVEMLGACDSWQQENDSFSSCRYELKALRCNTLKTDKQKQAWVGKTSEPLTRTEQVMVAGDSIFADLSVSEGLLLARAFDLGCFCQALRPSPPVIHVGTSDKRRISCVSTSLWSLAHVVFLYILTGEGLDVSCRPTGSIR